jgi:formylglycine-generating enzyme required for sulfatase activity
MRRGYRACAGAFALGACGALLVWAFRHGARQPLRAEPARGVTPAAEREVKRAARARTETAMVAIPAGSYEPFYRRASAGAPLHVEAFRLDREPVARAEFLEFVEENPRWRRSAVAPLFAEAPYLSDWPADLDPGPLPSRAPVTYVSWFAAKAYCEYRGKRLPTVTEWERAAGGAGEQGGTPFRFAMGRAAPGLPELSFGAIWEWTHDYNSVLVSGRSDDGSTSSLFCGDGYRASDARNYGGFLRFSFRSSLKANYALENLGFRCARGQS